MIVEMKFKQIGVTQQNTKSSTFSPTAFDDQLPVLGNP